MELDISEIKGIIGKSIEFETEVSVPHLEYGGEIYPFASPIRVKGTVENAGNRNYIVEASIKAEINVPCFRCLTITHEVLDINFNRQYSDIAKDEETVIFRGDEIKLLPDILDEIVLHIPGKILCNPDCKGLCPTCGVNLNTGSCRCDEARIDPRMAALKKLIRND